MPRFNRRRFIERLGLWASAPLLAPIAHTLIGEAHGAVPQPRRISMYFVIGENMPNAAPYGLMPEGITAAEAKWDAKGAQLISRAVAAPPGFLTPLSQFWKNMAIVDGLSFPSDFTRTQHGLGFSCLSGVMTAEAGPEIGGPPGAVTVDQHVAQRIGKQTPLSSILFGMSGNEASDSASNTFAAGLRKPLAHIGKPSLLYAQLLGKGSGKAPGGDGQTRLLLQTKLLDSMRSDVKRLQAALAGQERERLDDYLSAIETFDLRQQELERTRQAGNCAMPPMAVDGTPEERLASMFRMAGLALRCGLTNVLGVSIANAFGHEDAKLFRTVFAHVPGFNEREGDYGSHNFDGKVYAPMMNKLYVFFLQQVAELLRSLGELAKDTSFLLLPGTTVSDFGHHASQKIGGIVYDGTGTLKTGGRYLLHPKGTQRVSDLLCSVSHAAGAPVDSFNQGKVMAQLMA
jgi:Protein of unknown function (DUF1552)